jgi:hypothetical protein
MNSKKNNINRLYDLQDLLDDLHSASTEGEVSRFTGASEAEVSALLRELIYTAQEALHEIHSHKVAQMPTLRVVEKISKVG